MGYADLHTHTTYSLDGTSTVSAVLAKAAREAHLDVIAITDHNTVRGALEGCALAARYGIQVIPGSEISTAEGHLLALFIYKDIPPRLSLIETLVRIGEQGGLAIAPHPANRGRQNLHFDTIRRAVAHPEAGSVLVGIETFNASFLHRKNNPGAAQLARELALAEIGSSDAHLLWLIGREKTAFPGQTAADLRRALEERTTRAVVGEPYIRPSFLLHWGARLILRGFGVVSWCPAPQAPLRLGRLPR